MGYQFNLVSILGQPCKYQFVVLHGNAFFHLFCHMALHPDGLCGNTSNTCLANLHEMLGILLPMQQVAGMFAKCWLA